MVKGATTLKKIYNPGFSKPAIVSPDPQDKIVKLPETRWVLSSPEDVRLFHHNERKADSTSHEDMLRDMAKTLLKEQKTTRTTK